MQMIWKMSLAGLGGLAAVLALGANASAQSSDEVAQSSAQASISPIVSPRQPVRSAQPAVVELFTSQGCSSCPPADALLKTFADRPDIVALTYHVDYWDYLGWKDTLAKAAFTHRQRAYAHTRGDGMIYTPQVVVNGMRHAVGSDRGEIEQAIAQVKAAVDGPRASMRTWVDGEAVLVEAMATSGDAGTVAGSVWLVVVEPRVEVKIMKGENRGRTVTYHNVVRDLLRLGAWSSGQSSQLSVPQAKAFPDASIRSALLLQRGDTGGIIAATWLSRDMR